MTTHNPEPIAPELIRPTLLPLKRWMPRDFWILLLIFFALYFFRLGQFSISIDDELEAMGNYSNVWILTGRWAGYVIDRYLLARSTIPFLPIFLFGIAMCMAYLQLLRAFGIQRARATDFLAFPFFAALPTWAFLAAFAANIASAGLGYLLAMRALARYRSCLDRLDEFGVLHALFSPGAVAAMLWLGIAIGIYQAFLFAFVTAALALLILASSRKSFTLRELQRQLFLLAGIVLGALLLYVAVDVMFRSITGLYSRSYLGSILDWNSLLHSPLGVTSKVLDSMGEAYGGRGSLYGITAFGFPLLIVCGIGTMMMLPALGSMQRAALWILGLAMFTTPFGLHFLAGGAMPARTLVAVPIVFWFCATLGMTTRHFRLAATTFAVVLVAILQIFYSSTLLQASNFFVRVHDQALAQALYARIVEVQPDSADTQALVVDFYGAKSFQTQYPRSSTSGFSFFEWDGGNEGRILAYMHLIGYTNLVTASTEQRERDLATFAKMATWPAHDSVRVVGQTTLIKLGDTPGYPFNTR
ncbi:MAG: glucosyltransferase domain-containing protein [Proteobacteria bacterium]|nr:glucosyltransferase domain-containing protein [Pseudomonadota bacterium]